MSDVPEGYRMSEVGVIPEDWEVKELGECLLKKPEYGINAAAVPYSDNLPVFIRITDISNDGKFLPAGKTSVNNIDSDKFLLEKDDIVFARTGASTGKTYLYNSNDGELVFAGFLIRVKVNPNKLIALYLKSYTETGTYWNWVKIMSMRSGQPGINGNEYAQLQILLPPLPEQEAIASALSDVDALIAALEQLITKKCSIKQGAMQQLLTGKKRLPGFGGEWEVKKLGEIADIDPDNLSNSTDPEYSFHYISLEDVDCGTLRNTTELLFKNAPSRARRKIRNEDILLSTVRPNLKSHLLLKKEISNWICSTGFSVVRCRNNMAQSGFVFNHLFSSVIDRQIETLTIGSNYPAINSKDVKSLLIPLPPTIEEQQAIGQILSDMDTEIESLKQKRNKYKAIKQGMMQELLTGKTRLV